MIEVVVTCNLRSDRAEADTPEGAVLAARTLFEEAYEREGGAFRPSVRLGLPDGRVLSLERRP